MRLRSIPSMFRHRSGRERRCRDLRRSIEIGDLRRNAALACERTRMRERCLPGVALDATEDALPGDVSVSAPLVLCVGDELRLISLRAAGSVP